MTSQQITQSGKKKKNSSQLIIEVDYLKQIDQFTGNFRDQKCQERPSPVIRLLGQIKLR